MSQYKLVSGPKSLRIGPDGNINDAMGQYQNIIQQEAQGGWELVCVTPIQVVQDPEPLPPLGCFPKLMCMFGLMTPPQEPEPTVRSVNALVFVKRG